MPTKYEYAEKPWYSGKKRNWVSVEEQKPTHFDLVDVRMSNGDFRKAWWTGSNWDAARFINNDSVQQWARVQ